MYLLQEAMAAGPFLLLAFVLGLIGICLLIYFLFKIDKTNKKIQQEKTNRTYLTGVRNSLVVFSLILLIALVIFFNWLCNIKLD